MSEQLRRAVTFSVAGTRLVGIVELPERPRQTALLVVTGGPQYRVGSHRQFALLARAAAANGFAAMTFDFRGSGDSGGTRTGFEELAPDIRAAIDELHRLVPAVGRVVLLGLCDAASAISIYAHNDNRVAGLVLLNPWVRGVGTVERARLESYYPARVRSKSFWHRLITGRVNIVASIRSFFRQLNIAAEETADLPDYVGHMEKGLEQFDGPILLILSGNDMTAQEFRQLVDDSASWHKIFVSPKVRQLHIELANHTFSSAAWRNEVAKETLAFLGQLEASDQ